MRIWIQAGRACCLDYSKAAAAWSEIVDCFGKAAMKVLHAGFLIEALLMFIALALLIDI
jgi:hypothetical protein